LKKRILVIGDDRTTQDLLVSELPDNSFQVFSAPGEMAIVFQLCLIQPDLIILDMSHGGEAALCRIRELSSAPVIVFVAKASSATRIEKLDCGADHCMIKPFDERELEARIRALLRRVQLSNRIGQQPAPVPVS
jgi:DNA-binding response OmpR family regulator